MNKIQLLLSVVGLLLLTAIDDGGCKSEPVTTVQSHSLEKTPEHVEVLSEEVQIATRSGTVSLCIVKLHTGERVCIAVGSGSSGTLTVAVSTLK